MYMLGTRFYAIGSNLCTILNWNQYNCIPTKTLFLFLLMIAGFFCSLSHIKIIRKKSTNRSLSIVNIP